MKKLEAKEAAMINGGTVFVTVQEYCRGSYPAHKLTHNILVSGTGDNEHKATQNYNTKLAAHKRSNQYIQHSHNQRTKPLP